MKVAIFFPLWEVFQRPLNDPTDVSTEGLSSAVITLTHAVNETSDKICLQRDDMVNLD